MIRRGVLFALACVLPLQVRAASPFDGVWSVNMNCPTTPDGTLGYSHLFTVRVTDGLLHGEYGKSGSPGWVSLEGSIPPSGKTTLLAHGLTGQAAFAVGRPTEMTPYVFHVDAKFDDAHGSGERIEARQCSFQFRRADSRHNVLGGLLGGLAPSVVRPSRRSRRTGDRTGKAGPSRPYPTC